MKKEIKKTSMLGEGCFIFISIVLHFLKNYYIGKSEVLKEFPWGNEVGILLLVFAFLIYCYERANNYSFFYGFSQRGGDNSNSFILFAVAINFFAFNDLPFFGVLIGISIAIMLLGFLISRESN